MAFYPEGKRIPAELRTEEFLVRPLRVSDVDADYQAVVESRDMLRVWDQTEWPSDTFTLEDNLASLERHEANHEAGSEFTFSIMDPQERRCLGCIYLLPLRPVLEALGVSKPSLEGVGQHAAYVSFWVRASELESGLDRRILDALLAWFRKDWALDPIAFGTHTADEHQVALFRDTGLSEAWTLPSADSSIVNLLFHP